MPLSGDSSVYDASLGFNEVSSVYGGSVYQIELGERTRGFVYNITVVSCSFDRFQHNFADFVFLLPREASEVSFGSCMSCCFIFKHELKLNVFSFKFMPAKILPMLMYAICPVYH